MVQPSGAFKIVKWVKPSYEHNADSVITLKLGDLEIFEPKSISLRRCNKTLLSKIKSTSGATRSGFVSKDWALLFLTQIRDKSLVHLVVKNARFSNGYTVNQGNFGPSCENFARHPNFLIRCIRTYLDNEDNFFFA